MEREERGRCKEEGRERRRRKAQKALRRRGRERGGKERKEGRALLNLPPVDQSPNCLMKTLLGLSIRHSNSAWG